ncbi:uncharacterized protein [Lolium perenne]|uniref:uncharacterized protein n=1 Tax=Lolium perenne TaxID=4522 RepID=UPI0021F5CB80|nr:uncharacterized protein LOC127332932 [Lolium perenne]
MRMKDFDSKWCDWVQKYIEKVSVGIRICWPYSLLEPKRMASGMAHFEKKKEAIAALPERLQAAALIPDMTPFPANRYMATLTPPIEGYIEKVRDAAKKYSVKEKLR